MPNTNNFKPLTKENRNKASKYKGKKRIDLSCQLKNFSYEISISGSSIVEVEGLAFKNCDHSVGQWSPLFVVVYFREVETTFTHLCTKIILPS